MKIALVILLSSLAISSNAQDLKPWEPLFQPCRLPGVGVGGLRSQGTRYIVYGVKTDTIDSLQQYVCPVRPLHCQTLVTIKVLPSHSMVEVMPYTSIRDLLPVWPAIRQVRRGDAVCIRGGRPEETLYVLDGMRIQ